MFSINKPMILLRNICDQNLFQKKRLTKINSKKKEITMGLILLTKL